MYCSRSKMLLKIALFFVILTPSLAYRTFRCEDHKCVKNSTESRDAVVSLQVCKLSCLPYGGLWPVPTGTLNISSTLVQVNPFDVDFTTSPEDLPDSTRELIKAAEQIFLTRIKGSNVPNSETHELLINTKISDLETTYFTYAADESYELVVSSQSNEIVQADISAPNFLGVRHGLETLAQLIAYDDERQQFVIPSAVNITDKPFYKHRGISLDTARAYFSVDAIKGVIDAMAQNKLNSFHWHITDTHSFPFVSETYPNMSAQGAYSKEKVYTAQNMRDIVEYAKQRGVRVTPELDAPAHVGEGWDALNRDFITCFKWEPWTLYCVEPPCGQFDPTQDGIYPALLSIYKEYAAIFQSDLFHMGGDEVNFNCWNSTPSIVEWMTSQNIAIDHAGFVKLWDYYQNKSREQVRIAFPEAKPIMWTSTLTEDANATKVLPPDDYIIQIWTRRDDKGIASLVQQNYSVIFSNYDQLYFDCGGGAWIGGGVQNWCGPYIGWQEVYNHDPLQILANLDVNVTERVQQLVLGSEAALWTEEVDEQMVEGRLFPRGAALAERLWTRPSWTWEDAQYRMNNHRERLVRNEVRAELLQPDWCYQNDGFCGLGVPKKEEKSENKKK